MRGLKLANCSISREPDPYNRIKNTDRLIFGAIGLFPITNQPAIYTLKYVGHCKEGWAAEIVDGPFGLLPNPRVVRVPVDNLILEQALTTGTNVLNYSTGALTIRQQLVFKRKHSYIKLCKV